MNECQLVRGALRAGTTLSARRHPTTPRAAPPMMGAGGACGPRPAKWVLDEKKFTPVPTKHRGTAVRASEARRRSYSRGSEVGDRCRPSLKP